MKKELEVYEEVNSKITDFQTEHIKEPKFIVLGQTSYFKLKKYLLGRPEKFGRFKSELNYGDNDITHYMGIEVVVNSIGDKRGGQYNPVNDRVEVVGS